MVFPVSLLTTVRSWASEVDHLGLLVLLSVMSITNERNFSVPLDKESINLGDDSGHRLLGKSCFMNFLGREGEVGTFAWEFP